MTRLAIPKPLKFLTYLLPLFGFCIQQSQATLGGTGDDLSQLPLQLTSCAFNPKDFQRLKGEIRHEENALRYLKKLEERSKQLPKAEDAFTDPDFLKARDQLADCFLKLFSYAAYLPSPGFSWLRITHANRLETVTFHPLFRKLIDGIYSQRPVLKDTVDDVYNEELTRDDFDYNVYIGKNPFFQPLCIFLDYLYNNPNKSILDSVLGRTRQHLEKRHTYFSYLRPLERVISQVSEIIHNGTEDEKTVEAVYNHLLIRDQQTSDDEEDNHYFSDEEATDFGSTSEDEENTSKIEDYLVRNQETMYNFKKLKDTINQNIDYRYGIKDRNPPIVFHDALIKARKSIPWTTLTILGSAAKYAMENGQPDIRRMFVQASNELSVDFKELQKHLNQLQSLEKDHFLGKDLTEIGVYNYPNIERFTAWYLNFIGLDMMRAHIRDVSRYAGSFDNAKTILGDSCNSCWRMNELASKLPFLKSKSRIFTLYYLFVDGELSKYFIKTLKGNVDETWIKLFGAFKTLRDDIMHKTQVEGQKKFEERLDSLDAGLWTGAVKSYSALLAQVNDLNMGYDQLKWQDLKQDRKEVIPSPDAARKAQLDRLQDNLEHLSTFIRTGSWEDPLMLLGKEYENAAEAFKKVLPEKYHQQFSPASLLTKVQEEWQQTFKTFGKGVNPGMRTHWSQMQDVAKQIKDYKALVKQSKAPKTSLQILRQNLENLQWTLSQLSQTYDKWQGRFSSIPEAKIAELYLITLRESANVVLDNLPNHLIFDATDQKTNKFFQAATSLSSTLYQIKLSFGNTKAHIHRLTEASSYEVDSQSVGILLAGHLENLKENTKIILNFLAQ